MSNKVENLAGIYARAGIVSLGLFAGYFFMNYVATFVPRTIIVQHLKDRATDLRGTISAPLRGRVFPRFDNNDCLVLGFVTQKYDNQFLEAFSPSQPQPEKIATPQNVEQSICLELIGLAEQPDPTDKNAQPYHRYLHGHRLYARVATAILPITGLSMPPTIISVAALLSVVIVGLYRGRRRDVAYAGVAICLLLFNAGWLFAYYFTHSLSDMVLAIFVGASYHFRLFAGTLKKTLLSAAVFASFVAIFEFLTGGIPFGVAAMIAFIGLDAPDKPFKGAFHATSVFLSIVAISFIAKILLAGFISGTGNVAFSFEELARWLPGKEATTTEWDEINAQRLGLTLQQIDANILLKLAFGFGKLLHFGGPRIGFGSGVAGLAVLGISVCAFCFSLLKVPFGERWIVFAGSAMVIPVWSAIFLNHAIAHAHWMFRPFTWFTALAAALLAFALMPTARSARRDC